MSVDEDFRPEGTDVVARRRRDVLHQRHVGGDIMTPRRQHPPWIRHASDDHVAGSNRRTGGYRVKADRGAGAGVPDEARSRRKRHCQTERSEEHTSELQSLMRISYAVFCLKKKKK